MAESTQPAAPAMIAEREPLDEVQQTQTALGASNSNAVDQMNGGNDQSNEANDNSHDAHRGGDGENVQGVVVTNAADLPEGKKKKSKKKNKPASKRGLVNVPDVPSTARSSYIVPGQTNRNGTILC